MGGRCRGGSRAGSRGPAGEAEGSVTGGGVVERPPREKLMSRAGWQPSRGNAVRFMRGAAYSHACRFGLPGSGAALSTSVAAVAHRRCPASWAGIGTRAASAAYPCPSHRSRRSAPYPDLVAGTFFPAAAKRATDAGFYSAFFSAAAFSRAFRSAISASIFWRNVAPDQESQRAMSAFAASYDSPWSSSHFTSS